MILALVMLSGMADAGFAQIVKPLPPEATAMADKFFTTLKSGDVSAAYHYAFKDSESVMGSANIDQVAAQTTGALKSFGTIEDWSPEGTNLVTTNLIQQIYFIRCAQIPMFYIIQFYNPGSGWRIIDVRFTTYNEGKASGMLDALKSASSK